MSVCLAQAILPESRELAVLQSTNVTPCPCVKVKADDRRKRPRMALVDGIAPMKERLASFALLGRDA